MTRQICKQKISVPIHANDANPLPRIEQDINYTNKQELQEMLKFLLLGYFGSLELRILK